MLLEIKKISKNDVISTIFLLDGVEVKIGFKLSRLLTKTTSEQYNGIFTTFCGPVEFRRNELSNTKMEKVSVFFDGFDFFDKDIHCSHIMDEIANRVRSVNEAFEMAAVKVIQYSIREF